MLTIRTSKFNTTIKKPSSVLFLWFHNSKGWFVGHSETIVGMQALPPGQRPHVRVVGLSETDRLRASVLIDPFAPLC